MTKVFLEYFVESTANVGIGNVSKDDMTNENFILQGFRSSILLTSMKDSVSNIRDVRCK